MHAPSRTALPSRNAFAPDRSTGGTHRSAAEPAQPELDSRRLLQGQREIVIRHGGECYRLRHTRNDKLILTK